MYKKLISLLSAVAAVVVCFSLAVPSYAWWTRDGEKKGEEQKSWTWDQADDPWNGLLGGGMGAYGCGLHSLVQIIRKSGVKDYTPGKFVQDVESSGYSWGFAPGGFFYQSPKLETVAKNIKPGSVQTGSQGAAPNPNYKWSWIRDQVKAGSQFIVHFRPNGGVHWIATDYVDKDNKLHVIDSGYPQQPKNTTLDYVLEQTNADKNYLSAYIEFKLADGKKWTAIDPEGKPVNGSAAEQQKDSKKDTSDSKKTSASAEDDKGLPSEDDLKGMPDRNDYTGGLLAEGYGAADDEDAKKKAKETEKKVTDSLSDAKALSDSEKKDLATLQENTKSLNDFSFNSFIHTLLALAGILVLVYGCLLIPLAWLLDRSTSMNRFSALGAVTFGRLRTLPAGVDKTDVNDPGVKQGNGRTYVDATDLIKRVIVAFVLAAVILSGAYKDVLLEGWWWLCDHVPSLKN